ncbi:MAG: metallophosphoesterase, partial [Candidatus Hydrogenedentota bacterium]
MVFEDANRSHLFDAGEKPLRGVVVSDGKAVTVTNEEGLYHIETKTGRIIFVSVPGTHHAPGNNFYRSLDGLSEKRQRVDFPLVANADSLDNDTFTFVFATDTHTGGLHNARDGTAKAYRAIAELKPALVIHGGDIILDALKLSDDALAQRQYELYKDQLVSLIKSPFYHALGNHDVFGWLASPGPDRVSPLYGKKMYEKYFGPAYYSFDYKHCHFVVLDSIAP